MSFVTQVSPYVLEGPVSDRPIASSVKVGTLYLDPVTESLWICAAPSGTQLWIAVNVTSSSGAGVLKFAASLQPDQDGSLGAGAGLLVRDSTADVDANVAPYPVGNSARAVVLVTNVSLPLPSGQLTLAFERVEGGAIATPTYMAGASGIRAAPGPLALSGGDRFVLRATGTGLDPNTPIPVSATVNLV